MRNKPRDDVKRQRSNDPGDGARLRAAITPGRRWIALSVFFASLAVAVTWPLAAHLTAGIPLGTERVATVPLFNLWTLAWNVESLERGYAGYWRAPIYHPAPDAFALSEPQPITGLAAAGLAWTTGSMLAAYNLILVGSLALNGLLACLLLRRLGLGFGPAVAGGCLVVVLPFSHQELGVLQLVPLAGVLALALAVLRFAEPGSSTRWAGGPSLANGLWLGGALALGYGLCVQTTVFAILAGAPAALWLWRRQLRAARTWGHLAAGALLFLALASPMLLAQARAATSESFERSRESALRHSARPAHYLKSAWPPLLPAPGIEAAERPSERAFWPGTLRLLLAAAAVTAGLRQAAWRRLTVAGLLVLLASLVLSFGPGFAVGGVSPVDSLRSLPALSQLRSYFRFALFVQLAIAGLAALGLELIHRSAKRRLAGIRSHLVVAALALVAILEVRPAMGKIQPLPPLDLDLPWLAWILDSTDPDDVLAFVPFPEGRSSADYLGTAQWMYWQTRHWRPMVNGYSGFFPERFRRLKKTMQSFPSDQALSALRQAGVRYCVVHRAFMKAAPPSELIPVFEDPQHALVVFEIRARS